MGDAEYGVRFLCWLILPAAEPLFSVDDCDMPDVVHGSCAPKKLSMLSGWALVGYADCGWSTFPNGIDVSN